MMYLVSGGAGFIGSNIFTELLIYRQKEVVLDKFTTGKRENILPLMKNPNLAIIEGSLRNINIVRSAVQEVDHIMHQAVLRSVPYTIDDPITLYDADILSMLNILEAVKEFGVIRVVCASSPSIYMNSENMHVI